MKRSALAILKRFGRTETGATAVIYALSLLPIMLLIGFAIDFRRAMSAEAHMQAALDSAVLSSAVDYSRGAFLSPSEREAEAQARLEATFAADIAGHEGRLSGLGVTFSVEDGAVRGTATAQLPMFFGGLFGRDNVSLSATSVADAGGPQRVEIVLALDNTTSMFRSSRFNQMRSAAKGFVNQMFDNAVGPDLTHIGVVPWATLVNINSERPGGFDPGPAPDRSVGADGRRSVPNRPFENRLKYLLEPEDDNNYTRAQMERDFAPVTWRGCVRSAPGERRVSGGGSVLGSLTDDSVPGMRWHAAFLEPELETVRAPAGFNDDDDDDDVDDDDDAPVDAGLPLDPGRVLRCSQRPERGSGNLHLDVDRACSDGNNRPVDGFVEACVSDPNEFEYFRSGGRACPWQENIFPWTRARRISGPNQNCPVAMLGLSQDRGQIIDKLDEMHPATGGTHMDLGLMWGLRMLSPNTTWARFFGQDRPRAYTDPSVRKVLILLSDGENVPPGPFEGYYGCTEGDTRGQAGPCWRADGVDRLNERALNALTEDSCEAIRDYGVELYTIAVDVNNGTALDLLADCAGDPSRAFNIRASEIEEVFQSIAARELRLVQ